MSRVLRAWPALEAVAVRRLQGLTGARVGTDLPPAVESLPSGFIRVSRGPGGDDGITDDPMLDVEAFHTSRISAWDLIEAARQSLLGLGGSAVEGDLVDRVATATGPSFVFYGPHVSRYVMALRVALRRAL